MFLANETIGQTKKGNQTLDMSKSDKIILGIHDAHDASAAIMVNGEIIAAAQEERYSRLKGDYGYPENAINYCLRKVGIESSEIDEVALASHSWNPVLTKIKRNANFSVKDWIREQEKYWKPTLIDGETVCYHDLFKNRSDFLYDETYPMDHLLDGYMDKANLKDIRNIRISTISNKLSISSERIRTVTHEECHCHYAYWGSRFRTEVLCMTAEGIGDYSNGTVSKFSRSGREELSSNKENHIGHIYQYITLLLGMKPNQHEYKVMGMAPYASEYEIEKAYNVLAEVLKVENLDIVFNKKPKDLYFHFREQLHGCRFDGISGAVQKMTEDLLSQWLVKCIEHTGLRNIVFSGGVAQNIKAIKCLSEISQVDDICVLPAAGDTSLSIGACYFSAWEQSSKGDFDVELIKPLESAYLGNSISEPEVINILAEAKSEGYCVKEKVTAKQVASELEKGSIVGRCSGRMEFGLRALGNRSILADQRKLDTVSKINTAIKFRDFWMPFTPSILDSRVEDYIKNPKNIPSPFMTHAYDSTNLAKMDLPAAMHPADLTVRPQVVAEAVNQNYFRIISEFEKKTGVGALLNTSFNLHGEPIVANAKDAYSTFCRSGLDALLINDSLIMKNTGSLT